MTFWHLWHLEIKGKGCTDSGSRLSVIQGCPARMESQLKYFCNGASTHDSGTPTIYIYIYIWCPNSFLMSRVGPEESKHEYMYVCVCVHVHLDALQTIFNHGNQFIYNEKGFQETGMWVQAGPSYIITCDLADIVVAVPVYILWLWLPYQVCCLSCS